MAKPQMARKRLTDDERAKIASSLEAGVRAADLAKQYNVSTNTIYTIGRSADEGNDVKPVGRPPAVTRVNLSADLMAKINEAIDSGMSQGEIQEKFQISDSTYFRAQKKAKLVPPPMTPQEIKMTLNFLTIVAEKHPDVFSQLGIKERLMKFPDVLMTLAMR